MTDYIVTFSLTTMESAVHAVGCPAARQSVTRVAEMVSAATPEQASADFAEREAFASRGIKLPRVCRCARYA